MITDSTTRNTADLPGLEEVRKEFEAATLPPANPWVISLRRPPGDDTPHKEFVDRHFGRIDPEKAHWKEADRFWKLRRRVVVEVA